jgi:hypothetical protein
MQQPEQQKELGFSGQLNLLVGLLVLSADPALPYVRRPGSLGERFFSVYTALAVCAMFLFIGAYNDPIALPALYLTCIMFFVHRVARLFQAKGKHSRSGGISWFRGEHACGVKEPLFIALSGIACLSSGFSKGLGSYLLFLAAPGLFLGHWHYRMRIASQVRQMTDSRIDAETLRSSFESYTRRNP